MENDPNHCYHDYDNPRRIGRAHYVCPRCGKDISLTLYVLRELEDLVEERKEAGE